MQHDYDINSSDSINGLQFRQDVNAVLSAIKSSNSGATAPTIYIAGTLWLDTSTTPHILKKRNTANTGWDTIRIEDALGAPIASGTTTTVGTYSGGNTIHITGTTTITSLGVSTTGTTRTLIFDSALTITHNATSLICPNGLSITTVSGDAITVICEDGALGYWRIISSARILPNHLADTINDAAAKTTPVDADLFGIADSATSFSLNKTTWANIKTALTAFFAPIASPIFTGAPTAPNFSYKPTPVTVTSWSYVTTTITLNVASHTFLTGDYIEVGGLTATTNIPNGVHLVTSVTATTIVFTYALTPTGTAGVSSATIKGYMTTNGRVESIGVGQTWQNVTSSRTLGTTYTNSTDKPIFVSLTKSLATTTQGSFYINDVFVGYFGYASAGSTSVTITYIIPNDSTYRLSSLMADAWSELR